jgi:hypothetical protein
LAEANVQPECCCFRMTLAPIVASRLSAGEGEAQIAAVFPIGVKQGSTSKVEIRGQHLKSTYAVWFDCDALHGISEV